MQASIQRIIDIKPIENADSLEKAYVLGWQVVVKKGEFKTGDLCVFVTIDSILPNKPEFAFMEKNKFRVRTIRLRGELSQGIIFPMSILPGTCRLGGGEGFAYELSQDVSEILEVTHYEKPAPSEPGFIQGETKGNWPPFFPHTDEERLQNFPELVDELRGKTAIITVKADGTSCTIFYNRGEFGVCSRNFEKKDSENSVYWQMARKYDLENKLKKTGRNLAIQGEIVGPGIQKNKLGLKELDFLVFDIYDIDDGKYVSSAQLLTLIPSLGLKGVDILQIKVNFAYEQEDLLELAKGKYPNTENDREGIVIRGFYGDYSQKLRKRLSFKVLNNVFLEKEKE